VVIDSFVEENSTSYQLRYTFEILCEDSSGDRQVDEMAAGARSTWHNLDNIRIILTIVTYGLPSLNEDQ